VRQAVIMGLMCNGTASVAEVSQHEPSGTPEVGATIGQSLDTLAADGLVRLQRDRLTVTACGRFFVRNLAMVFDAYLAAAPQQQGPRFSRTV